MLLAVLLLCVGLFNATLALSKKGFYGMSFILALFGAIAVQKNTRDIQAAQPLVIDPALVQHVPDTSTFAQQND